MIRRLATHPSVTGKAPWTFGEVPGIARFLRLPGNRAGVVWASVGTDGILRTLTETYPAGQPGPLKDVADYLVFLRWSL